MRTYLQKIEPGIVVGVASKAMVTTVALRNAGEPVQLSTTHAKTVAEKVIMTVYVKGRHQDNTAPQPSTWDMKIHHLIQKF